MHLDEGLLTTSTSGLLVLGAGMAVAAAGTALGLRKLDYERMPQVAMLSAAFFVASLIHLPLGVTSVHLVLNGLVGLILGWTAFPALLIALGLQAVFFGFGGPMTLGLNTAAMAVPAVVCHYLFQPATRAQREGVAVAAGFAAGALAILLSAALVSSALVATGQHFAVVWKLVLVAHLPVAVVEGLVTASVVAFLRKVRPELLDASLLGPVCLETSDA
jgi:cobalt/nickel transport system permease protein